MVPPELEQNLNISPEVLQKEQVIPEEQVKLEVSPAEEIEEKIESIPIPFLKEAKLKVPEGMRVNFKDKDIKKKIREFFRSSMKYIGFYRKVELGEEGKEKMKEVLVPFAEEEDWRGIESEKKNAETTVYLVDSKVKVKDEALVREMIPEEYHSKLLDVKYTKPAASRSFLVINYKLYRKLQKEGKVPTLPKTAIEKPSWGIKVLLLHKFLK